MRCHMLRSTFEFVLLLVLLSFTLVDLTVSAFLKDERREARGFRRRHVKRVKVDGTVHGALMALLS